VQPSPYRLTETASDSVNTPAQLSPSSAAIANVDQTRSNDRKRKYEDTIVESDRETDGLGIETLSIHGVGRSTFRRNPNDHKPILCNICRQPFDTDNLPSLFSHLNDHFRGFNTVNRCNECEIDFVEKAELDKHRISAAKGHCGFEFHHTEPCTGHHPPGQDHIKLWDRIRHWQQCQLQSFIDRVDEVSKRLGKRYTQTENSTACRGCRILDFYHQCYPEDYWALHKKHAEKSRSQGPNGSQCCHIDMTDAATDQLLSKLTSRRRRRRASSADADFIRQDTNVSRHKERWSVQSPAPSIESDVSGILDAAYLSDPLQGLLHWAACAGDCATIEAFLLNGADINGSDISGRTALHWAAASGSCDAVELLLSYDANITVSDHAKQTPLFVAVECGNSDVVKMLLDRGSDPNEVDSIPQACLHIAANAGHNKVVTTLLSSGAHVDNVELFGRSPLHLAAKSGHLDVVRILCNSNASLELQEHAGRTALCIAIENDNFDIARYLIHRGALVTMSMLAKASAKAPDQDLLELMRSTTIFREVKDDRN
jgi:ankyrin repeat protein